MKWLFTIGLFFILAEVSAQSKGNLSGWVIDKNTQKPIAGVSVKLVNTIYSTFTDTTGKYNFKAIPTGQYQIKFTSLGSAPLTLFNVIVSTGNETNNTIELITESVQLTTVQVGSNKKTVRVATLETPLSVQRLTAEEIKSSPGANFDISKVVQSLPGVTGSASTGAGFRNDIIVRGGAPNENVFYLDGIEIPVINHFSTQGSAGGPQGILNVSFIDEVKLSSSAFDAKFDNALSSVFEFKQKRGNTDKLQGNLRLGATEFASTFEGPLSKSGKTTFLASARRSYLQFLFKLIDLPIRPNFWDFQFKVTHVIDPKTTLTFLGVGAIDEFAFAAPKNATPQKIYALNSSPSINQWSYTVGVSLKKLITKGYWNLAISRNHLNNVNEKYENNLAPIKGEKTFDYSSNELGNNIRWDITKSLLGLKWTTGLNLVNVGYDNSTFQLLRVNDITNPTSKLTPSTTINYNAAFNYNKYGAFFQVGKRAFDNRLGISAGIRTDGNSFTTQGNRFMHQLSPRMGLSWVWSDKLTWNASIGNYFKLAPNTALGFKDSQGNYLNRDADYIQSTHYVTGLEYIPSDATRFTAEVFYKKYNNVPISVDKGTSLSNLGADFNILGNEDISTIGLGRSYGYELFAQQKLTKRFFGVMSYSFFRSSYTNLLGTYIPSSWENIHLISLSGGYKFNKNWELGIKFRYQGGTPYTPYDMNASKLNFASLGVGILDYSKLNAYRNKPYHSSDFRLDKRYNYKKSTLDFYIDITNWYGAKSVSPPYYIFSYNENGTFHTTDGLPVKKDGSNAIPALTDNNTVFITPTVGFIFEF
jgi:TonB dependent receptor/Carboxypeptidase regulatory-like domain/TonB-dependent Receptor Plug Domain